MQAHSICDGRHQTGVALVLARHGQARLLVLICQVVCLSDRVSDVLEEPRWNSVNPRAARDETWIWYNTRRSVQARQPLQFNEYVACFPDLRRIIDVGIVAGPKV